MAWSTRFFTAVAFLAVGVLFAPDVFGSGPEAPAAAVTAAKTCHLFHRLGHGAPPCGYLPRHQFGNLQSKMFPAYFTMMMKKRHNIERDLNISDEVGASKNTEAAKINARLKSMNKKFGMIHGLSSLANIMAFGSLAIHSLYLAGKLHF
ncbi:hypothetical protein ZIOFF_005657 [Zingiber officinale]|uniref:TMEM205-like domain-containing protein n=1 Tax=Zingiber officinale TaxID=94328 RepID=A0A8J5HXB4_ZINOF|nr:hypothetical protein ZIOFF_005657 [Zingiber officinale]